MPAVEPASLLYVCTANICRSPMAEHLARAELSRRRCAGPDVTVVSAGVAARDGYPMDETAARTLRAMGVETGDGTSRRLRAEHVAGAALVLVAERQHRAAAVRLVPTAVRRCFTVREFDRLLTTVDAAALPEGDLSARLAALIVQVGQARGTLPPVAPEEDDVADPYRQGQDAMRACAEQLAGSVARWADLLTAGRDGGAG